MNREVEKQINTKRSILGRLRKYQATLRKNGDPDGQLGDLAVQIGALETQINVLMTQL